MKGALVMVEICVVCGWWFSNQFDIVSEAPYSCDTVGHELKWAILWSLLSPETDWNICIGKQGYVFILTDFKKWRLDVSFLTSICVSNYFVTEKFESKQDQFCFCWRLLQFLFWVIFSKRNSFYLCQVSRTCWIPWLALVMRAKSCF